MPQYSVVCEMIYHGSRIVEANSEEEAMKIVEEDGELPLDKEFSKGSMEVLEANIIEEES